MVTLTEIGVALLLCIFASLAFKFGPTLTPYVKHQLIAPPAAATELITGEYDQASTGKERPYDKVHVLLLSWVGIDPRIHKQLVKLERVFRDYYNYDEGESTIKKFLIPSEDSKNLLDAELSQFLDNKDQETLLIIYYGGHGSLNAERRAVWRKLEKDGPEVPWHDLQTKLFERRSDVLLLVDCCAAAGAGSVTQTRGLVEVIFAGGFEAPTPVWGPHSFTTNLIAEMKKVHDSGTTVHNLHDNLRNTLQSYRLPQDGRERMAEPIHAYLAPRPAPQPIRSIRLQSLLSTAPMKMQHDFIAQGPSLQRTRSFDIVKLQAKLKELHKWLEPVDQSKFHNSTTAAQEEGTFKWLFQHTKFKRWENGTNRYMIVCGKVGCGKTVLCAAVANHLEHLCRTPNHSHLTAKFYFSFESLSNQHHLDSLLRSLIQQLSFAPEIYSNLKELHEENQKTWPPTSPSVSSLQQLLFAGLTARCSNEKIPRKVFIVIDALDEIPKGRKRIEVVNFLKDLAAVPAQFLHVLVTTRPKSDIILPLIRGDSSWTALYVDEAEISKDIRIFVDAALDSDFEPPLSHGIKEKIRTRLTKDKHGMFRWARLQMESLKRLEPASSQMVEAALKSLPLDLNATYLKMLKEIDLHHQRQAALVLIWLCFTSRPLYIEEVVEISATDPNMKPEFKEARRFEKQEHVQQILKDLVSIEPPLDGLDPVPRRNVVRLSHFSVEEYLTGSEILLSEAKIFSVSSKADQFLAQACLAYLFHNNSDVKSEKTYCLREYAWNQWAWHGVESHPTNRLEEAMELFDSCVYEQDFSAGLSRLRALHLVEWVDPSSETENSRLRSAVRTPWSYRDSRLHFAFALNSFEYQPLRSASDIRLVRILPSEYNSPEIRCEMVHVSLNERPVYDAISYTWQYYGREKASYIRLDGQPSKVRGKVADILRTLRSTNSSTFVDVWIDSLCINMPDQTERSSQVNLMSRIYHQAREVAVILEGDDVKASTIEILEELSSALVYDDVPESNFQSLQQALADHDSRTAWNMILTLFSQSWWRRMWPIQEIVLASRATIIYGKMRVNFNDIRRILVKESEARQLFGRIFAERETSPVIAFTRTNTHWAAAQALGELRMIMQREGKLELPHLLYASRFSKVSFPPDRVFSIYPLSLMGADPRTIAPGMSIDYYLSSEKTLINCSTYLLNQYRNLDHFSYIDRRFGGTTYELPSWASTFMSPPENQNVEHEEPAPIGGDTSILRAIRWPPTRPSPRPLVNGHFQPLEGVDLYSACGTATTAVMEFYDNDLIIRKGVIVDTVSAREDLYCDEVYAGLLNSRSSVREFQDYTISRAVRFYINHFQSSPPEVFWRTITAGQWQLGSRSLPSDWPSWSIEGADDHGPKLPPDYSVPSGFAFAENRCIFKTESNRFGLGPPDTRAGDLIMVLPGGKVPFVLRRSSGYITTIEPPTDMPNLRLRLVGECYVNDVMDGEIMHAAEAGKYKFQDIVIE